MVADCIGQGVNKHQWDPADPVTLDFGSGAGRTLHEGALTNQDLELYHELVQAMSQGPKTHVGVMVITHSMGGQELTTYSLSEDNGLALIVAMLLGFRPVTDKAKAELQEAIDQIPSLLREHNPIKKVVPS